MNNFLTYWLFTYLHMLSIHRVNYKKWDDGKFYHWPDQKGWKHYQDWKNEYFLIQLPICLHLPYAGYKHLLHFQLPSVHLPHEGCPHVYDQGPVCFL